MSGPIEVVAGGCVWHVRPEHRQLLLNPSGLRMNEWLRQGSARVVKHGPNRTVFRVELPELLFYVKHYPITGVRSWLRQLVRPTKGYAEYERTLAVAARGIPTHQALAFGARRAAPWPGDSFLLTHGLEATEMLSTFLETTLPWLPLQRQRTIRPRLAVALGKLIARMHNAGVLHQDLHPANLLVRLGVDDEPLLFLIDLHAVRLTEPLDWTTGRDNLVMLNRWFALRVSRADRLRFWLSYAQARDQACMRRWSGSVLETVSRRAGIERALLPLADQLEQRTWTSNLRFWKHRDRRCLVTNKYYRRVHSGVADGFSVTDLDAAALKPFLDNPDGPFERAGIKLLKDSRSSTVGELEVPLGGKRTPVIYKRFRITAWSDPWVSLARRSGALRSWVFGHGLRERCLPTPRPLAVLHRRRHGLQGEGYLLTEKLENAVDLHGWLATLETLPPSARLGPIRELIDQCARLIRELHRRRLTHRDLKAANLLVTGDTSQRPQLWFIDLVGVRLQRRLPRARRVQNLARLNASFHASNALTRTDRLRFLRIYLQWALRGRRGWKRAWREIEEATTAKVARNRRVGRPLA